MGGAANVDPSARNYPRCGLKLYSDGNAERKTYALVRIAVILTQSIFAGPFVRKLGDDSNYDNMVCVVGRRRSFVLADP